jgi:hypothetical protein
MGKLIGLFLFFAFIFLAAIGWVMNIAKLFYATGFGEVAVRLIGMIAFPLGALLGWVG